MSTKISFSALPPNISTAQLRSQAKRPEFRRKPLSRLQRCTPSRVSCCSDPGHSHRPHPTNPTRSTHATRYLDLLKNPRIKKNISKRLLRKGKHEKSPKPSQNTGQAHPTPPTDRPATQRSLLARSLRWRLVFQELPTSLRGPLFGRGASPKAERWLER